jgi:2-octaprenyl-6-methoxyphenol hydroxylase
VWNEAAQSAQPILDMVVTDSRVTDVVRPVFLSFAGEVEPGEPFAHMIENRDLVSALLAKTRELGITLKAGAVTGFQARTAHIAVQLSDATTVSARLLVAADGARSRLRELAGIPTYGWTYPQSAIVTNVAHERDHAGRAWEHFLPSGPFAVLPLRDRRCSIVWTEEAEAAQAIVALPDDLFHAELERRFGHELGEIKIISPRRVHPLGYSVARSFIADRLALVGDAAHVIHPIAGQGLNMGLRDVAALAEAVVDAVRLGLDPGSQEVLERYQRWRRFDTMTMGLVTDALNRLFSNRSDLLRFVRDFGLGIVDRLPGLKHLFIREAAGITGEVPKLLRGEAL